MIREPAAGDEANLDYARRQTDLVIEKLAEQLREDRVDSELLDRLGWSQEDLARFVKRWQNLQQAARQDKADGKHRQELDTALRSLGLRRQLRRRSLDARKDNLRDVNEAFRGTVPLEYQEQLRAYLRGINAPRD